MADNKSQVFAAITDPTRREILQLLGESDGVTAGEIARHFPTITRAAVSAHLRVLRSADLVEEERRGQFRHYRLGPNRADEVLQFLISVYSHDLDEFLGKG